jgi:two-component system, OmpR family, sensor histidine kinase MprB
LKLKTRLALAAGVAMGVAIVAISSIIFFAIKAQLLGQIDQALSDRAQVVASYSRQYENLFGHGGTGGADRANETYTVPPSRLGGAVGLTQLVLLDGTLVRPPDQEVSLPAGDRTLAVAKGKQGDFFSDTMVEGGHLRVFTAQLGDGVALQVARPMEEVDSVLRQLVFIFAAMSAAGSVLAAGLGRVVAGTALSPVTELTEAAEKVASTKDLAQRIAVKSDDEIGRLASSFNAMLEALDSSQTAQRQLVSDASHELRTPLTSLRTNIEVLARADELSKEEREKLLDDVVGQLDELTWLVADVSELARGDLPEYQMEEIRLDLLAEKAVAGARRNWPHVRFRLEAESTTVNGIGPRLERALVNLLDNAAKWSPDDEEVAATVAGGEVVVRDRGPGIAEEDLPLVFDRFYRAAGSRGMPGSGIGLAIVRQVAELHGGTVEAGNSPDGGAVLRLKLPTL